MFSPLYSKPCLRIGIVEWLHSSGSIGKGNSMAKQFIGIVALDNKEDLHKQRKLKEILSEKILSYDK